VKSKDVISQVFLGKLLDGEGKKFYFELRGEVERKYKRRLGALPRLLCLYALKKFWEKPRGKSFSSQTHVKFINVTVYQDNHEEV